MRCCKLHVLVHDIIASYLLEEFGLMHVGRPRRKCMHVACRLGGFLCANRGLSFDSHYRSELEIHTRCQIGKRDAYETAKTQVRKEGISMFKLGKSSSNCWRNNSVPSLIASC
jgi:hypothetical protein